MKRLTLRAAAALALTAAALQPAAAVPPPPDDVRGVGALNALALQLYHEVAAEPGENVFLSPASIQACLALALSGAEGETAEQVAAVLQLPGPREDALAALAAALRTLAKDPASAGVTLNVANRFWGQQGLPWEAPWLAELQGRFGSELGQLDFPADPEAARQALNAWVAGRTEQLIPDLFAPGTIHAVTRAVLANAIYFKGDWAHAFDRQQTSDGPFWTSGTTQITTPLMVQMAQHRYAHVPEAGLQVLRLPYQGEQVSMVVLLPEARDGLAAVERRLTPEALAGWIAALRPREVAVTLPRFSARSKLLLGPTLSRLGMPRAFGPQAEFGRMLRSERLWIDAVVHEAVVQVDERGTVAAAATGTTMRGTDAMEPAPAVFRADHPFLFLLRDDRTGAILFIGRFAAPS